MSTLFLQWVKFSATHMLKLLAKNSKQWQKQDMIKELLLTHINIYSELLNF